MTIFISHAVADRQLVGELVNLLQLGTGVPHTQIFCSSRSGSIPNGIYFVQHILKHLEAADLIVSVVSQSYLKSEFCLEELGAARMRHNAGTARSFSVLVSPVGYSEVNGVLFGVQSGEIIDAGVLDGLRDAVVTGMIDPPSTAIWNEARDRFLGTVKRIVNRQEAVALLKSLTLQDVVYERSADAAINYKLKLRIVLRNDTGHDLDIGALDWKSGVGDVQPQLPRGMGLEAEDNGGWERGSWIDGGASVHVPAGRAMRAWVGLAPLVNDDELRRRHETERLGTLVLSITITGYEEVTLEIQL